MIRTALLTLFLIAIGLGFALPQTATLLGGIGDIDTYRSAVLWGVPAAALVLSILFRPRLPRPEGEGPGPLPRRLVLLAVAALAFAADQGFLGLSSWTGWATFTFSDRDMSASQLALTAAWALPACLVLGIWGWERALRGAVYAGWRRTMPPGPAIGLAALAGLALALPAILPGGEVRDAAFVAASLVTVLCREISLALLFARGGGLLVAGLYRGALTFLEAFVVHDWNSLYFPAYSYVASGIPFYAARAASALLGLIVVAALTRPTRVPAPVPAPEEEEIP
ncbi:MAG TPA: hypothetical protein VH394_00770 [Thermoanaerobaculia bacterium]|nr:hypothetical protein [Thermoanaerobaculia bacterium]